MEGFERDARFGQRVAVSPRDWPAPPPPVKKSSAPHLFFERPTFFLQIQGRAPDPFHDQLGSSGASFGTTATRVAVLATTRTGALPSIMRGA